jgi:formylglycine-generating enzyme required for sulfatase activity
MTPPDRTPVPPEDRLISWLVEYDEALGVGSAARHPGGEDLPPELIPRLHGAMSCLHLLERAWPRSGTVTDPDGSPSRPGSAPSETPTVSSPGDAPAPPPDRVPGAGVWRDWVPGFEIREWIGGGGMGDVFRARQTRLGREVALKILRPAFLADPERLARFRREAEVAAGLQDPHLLPVYDVLEVRGVPVIVLPLVDGCDLGRILSDRTLVQRGEPSEGRHPWSALADADFLDRVLPVLDQVVEAVAVLHRAGVLHRDVKPSNVLVDGRGHVQISDFGLARLGEEAALTSPGRELGTPGFMSPEQWAGQPDVDARADLFGLGVTLYQALTLAAPFGKARLTANHPPPAPISALQPLLPAVFDAVVLKSLEPDRRHRYASAAALQADWQRVRSGQAPLATRPGPLRRATRRMRRPVPLAVLAVMLIGLIGSLGLLAFLGHWQREEPPVPRDVHIDTDPPGAQIVFVPIDPATGQPLLDQSIQPRDQRTPVRLRLLPGDYVVEVLLDDGRFHEVRRHVPRPGELPQFYAHWRWTKGNDGVITLVTIRIQTPTDLGEMARFEGRVTPAIAGGLAPDGLAHDRNLPAFYLDPTEVPWARYIEVMKLPPVNSRNRVHDPPQDEAVRFIPHGEATYYAELLGKRLPDEWEYELASTAGGTRPFPWGDEPRSRFDPAWPFGPVGVSKFDHTGDPTSVIGLYSNVAEWTSTVMMVPRAQRAGVSAQLSVRNMDSVARGAPLSVAQGRPDPAEFNLGPCHRLFLSRVSGYPGVGFRCARSVRPRFLKAIP